jgi:hypothetical protein
VSALSSLLYTLFGKYSELLKDRFSEDFLEIVTTDDYMPMPINKMDEYDKVVNVSWYEPDKKREELTYVGTGLDRQCICANMCVVSPAFSHFPKCTLSAALTYAIS